MLYTVQQPTQDVVVSIKKTAWVATLLGAVFFPEKQDTREGTQKWKIFFISEFSPESKQKVKWADEYAL